MSEITLEEIYKAAGFDTIVLDLHAAQLSECVKLMKKFYDNKIKEDKLELLNEVSDAIIEVQENGQVKVKSPSELFFYIEERKKKIEES